MAPGLDTQRTQSEAWTHVWLSPFGLRNHAAVERATIITRPMTRLQLLNFIKAQPRVEIAWCLTRMLVWAESGRGVGELGWRAQRRQPLLGGISSLDECYRMPGSFDGAGGRTSNRLSGAAWHNEGGVDESSYLDAGAPGAGLPEAELAGGGSI
ncbi:hypothetical protein PCH_Pc15g00370 [Penicillium rubens Wisconsin 54-1255]|uniref:Uncharacterized protein n=1 Tax=Penicillium rubens (strain ATCC 28089 / DSM 1075 / NRRL 1951 / Wisconsin 54-1255) TaxID=500485 RepID=B6H6I3_PENRW|nr:hypothetical protein PCH_Pc15g00370 [Penicillium rubens Wisconsin 54-1255]